MYKKKKKRFSFLPWFVVGMSFIFPAYAQKSMVQTLSLEQIFDLAEKNSHSLRTYDLATQEAQQAVKVAKNALLPSIDANVSFSYIADGWTIDRDFGNASHAPMPHFGNNFSIEASQVLYAGGAITNNIALAKLSRQIAGLDQERNRQEIRFLLAGNYLELYKLYNQAKVYRRNIEQTNRLLEEITAKEKEGLAIRNDITRYELQLKSLELQLTQIENNQLIINNQLITVLGLPPETVIGVDTCIIKKLPALTSETEWQEIAVGALPTWKQTQLRVEQSQRREELARAERRPSVRLFVSDVLNGPILIEVPPIDKNFSYWCAGVGVKFSFSSLYKSSRNIRRMKIATLKAKENQSLVMEKMQTDIKAEYIRFGEAFTIYDTQVKSLELAVQNYAVVRNRYLNDLALITDMLDADNSKLNAELQVTNAHINILFCYYKLKKTAGVL